MSFALTTAQVKERQKTVTRRIGWRSLKPGDRLLAVPKVMGFRKGEQAPAPIATIEVVCVERQRLDAMPFKDVRAEGFPGWTPERFVTMFCEANGCTRDVEVTRIEFRYVEPAP